MRAWYCVRSQPKHEHIAAAHLKRSRDIEVYLPRIRFKRSTRQGPAWFTEALFRAIFSPLRSCPLLPASASRAGVRGVVHFGGQWPQVPIKSSRNSGRQSVPTAST